MCREYKNVIMILVSKVSVLPDKIMWIVKISAYRYTQDNNLMLNAGSAVSIIPRSACT